MRNAFGVVEEFERRVAEFSGSPHAVAVDCCTHALLLSCEFKMVATVTIPAKTYISVPFAIIQAGGSVEFDDTVWRGTYQLKPYSIWDGAKRFRRGMYQGGLHCLSFHAKKHLNIGRGGMILCENEQQRDWLRKARYDGRAGVSYEKERVETIGHHFYMTPEQAARGLLLLDLLPSPNLPDHEEDYPDLRLMPVFQKDKK